MTDKPPPRRAKIGPREEATARAHTADWLEASTPSIPEPTDGAAIVEAVPRPPEGVINIANSRLVVVRAILIAWDLESILKAAGYSTHYFELPWTEALLPAVAAHRVSFAIFNHQRTLNFLSTAPQPAIELLGVLGHSMGGRNFCVLAHRQSRWAAIGAAAFIADPRNSRIYLGLHSDRYHNLLRALDMTEGQLKAFNVQCVNVPEPGLEVFETDRDALLVGGQNTRFEALLTGDFFELLGYEALSASAREWFRNSAANALVISSETQKELGGVASGLFRSLKRNFYARWHDGAEFDGLLRRLIDECDFAVPGMNERELIARHVLYESYRIGEPVW